MIHEKVVVECPGTPFKLGKRMLILPPLSLLQLETFAQPLAEFKGISEGMSGGDIKQISMIIDIVQAALSRNYPEITREEVGADIDFASAIPSMNALVKVSGLVDRVPEEDKGEPGER